MQKRSTWQNINGLLILDKPIGLSSNQALQKVRRIFQAKKAGHTGTLDVLASGLLPVCFGEATKFSQYLLDADKIYHTVAELGKRTSTCDAEGEVTEEKPISHVDLPLIEKALAQFTGEIEQIPSMYSALKHKGQPLYKLARQGIEVERKKRVVTISQLNLLSFTDGLLELEVHCSKGTYIRNLVDDIGQQLNCGAYVKSLRRLASGPFQAEQMHTIEDVEQAKLTGNLDGLLSPMDSLVSQFPAIVLTGEQIIKLQQGQAVLMNLELSPGLFRVYGEAEHFIGLGEVFKDALLKAKRLCCL